MTTVVLNKLVFNSIPVIGVLTHLDASRSSPLTLFIRIVQIYYQGHHIKHGVLFSDHCFCSCARHIFQLKSYYHSLPLIQDESQTQVLVFSLITYSRLDPD